MQRPVIEPELCNHSVITSKLAGFPLAGVAPVSFLRQPGDYLPMITSVFLPGEWFLNQAVVSEPQENGTLCCQAHTGSFSSVKGHFRGNYYTLHRTKYFSHCAEMYLEWRNYA